MLATHDIATGLIRPVWRGRMHSWAFVAAIPAGLMLVVGAAGGAARTAAAIYAATVIALFGTSAAYHRLTRTDRSKRIMQRIDHSMIYLLIAGTYTPLCVIALPRAWGVPVLASVVAVAVVGIGLKIADRAKSLAYALYPVMVWAAIIALPVMARHLSVSQLALFVGGAAAYGVGVLVLMHRRPDPWPTLFGYHEIWHAMTIVAATLHFVAIINVVS